MAASEVPSEIPSGARDLILDAGTKLGSYEITGALGAGGMGEVYRARDAKLGRDVALKVLPQAFARDADRMARVQREAKVLASLNHPNIASIYGLEDSGSTHALVMELVEGPTLADRIRSGPIPVDEALRIAKQICEALEYAHERGIVHRDLKPTNVKVTSDDAVKVLDFGLAKAIEGDAASFDISTSPTISRLATMQGVLLGTAAYMSPEQAKGKSVDRRADIWAFGCVLYEMLAGKMAFHGETVTDTLAAVIKEEPDWSRLPAGTPIRVRVLLQRCLQKDPKQRLRDIGDARISIDEVLSGAPDASLIGATSISPPLWRRVLPWALFGATAAAFAAFVWLHEGHLRRAPADLVRLQIPLPLKPPLRLSGLFALSPDGRQLAFVATSTDGVPRIWIRALNSLEIRPIPGTESVGNELFWSPDSRFVAFDAGGKLQKIDISGGPTQTVCVLNSDAVGGSWNADGVIILGQYPGTLMRVPAAGGVATQLTALDTSHGDIAHTVPWFLPDGRHFVYMRDSGPGSAISVGSLDVKPEEQDSRRLIRTDSGAAYVPSSDPESGQLLFLLGGALMAQPFDTRRLNLSGEPVRVVEEPVRAFLDYSLFSVSASGTLSYLPGGNVDSQLTWFDLRGKVLGTVGEVAPYAGLALSPDGLQAIVARPTPPDQHWTLWLFDLPRGTSTRLEPSSNSSDGGAVWAADGHRVVFASDRAGQSDLYEKPVSGPGDVQALLRSSDFKLPLSWSADARFVMYSVVGGPTKSDLWVLPLQASQKAVPFLRTEYNEFCARFSPDGRWVAYASDESGRDEVYVRPFSPDSPGAAASGTGDKFLISDNGGSTVIWQRDGKELYYIDLDGKLMVVDVATRPVFHASVPRVLFQAPKISNGFGLGPWAPSPDGKRFLFLVPQTQEQVPFTVVLNWQAGLKK